MKQVILREASLVLVLSMQNPRMLRLQYPRSQKNIEQLTSSKGSTLHNKIPTAPYHFLQTKKGIFVLHSSTYHFSEVLVQKSSRTKCSEAVISS